MIRSVLARIGSWISDGQAGMNKKRDSADCEYRRRLREHEVRSNRLSCVVEPREARHESLGKYSAVRRIKLFFLL